MTKTAVERRAFLQQAALLTAAVLIPMLQSCKPGSRSKAFWPESLRNMIDKAELQAIGLSYVQSHPSEASAEHLIQLLLKECSEGDQANSDALKRYFKKKVQEDFSQGRTTLVKGWVLAQTEARQCALFSLTFPE